MLFRSTIGTHTLTATAAHDPADGGTDNNAANDSASTTAEVTAVTAVSDVDVNITSDGGSCQNPCTRPVEVDVTNSGPDDISSVTVELSSDLDGLLDTIEQLQGSPLPASDTRAALRTWRSLRPCLPSAEIRNARRTKSAWN